MGDQSTGRDLTGAFKKGAAFGTAVAGGAGDGVLLLPHTITKERENNLDDSLGISHSKLADPSSIKVEGGLNAYLRYEGLDLLLAMCMGATGGAPAQQVATAAYLQTISFADCLDGLFGTLAVNLNKMVEEFPSVKVMGFVLKGETGQALEIEFKVIADDLVEDSSTNTTATMANVTFKDTGNRVLFRQGVFRLNLQSGAGLASPTDDIKPMSFELTFDRPHAGQYGAGASADVIDEPTSEEVPKIELKLTLPRIVDEAHFTAWDSGVSYKGDMTFTGAVIEAPYNYSHLLEFPNLIYKGVNNAHEQGAINQELVFDVVGAAVAPTGMVGLTTPLLITLINTLTTDVLA